MAAALLMIQSGGSFFVFVIVFVFVFVIPDKYIRRVLSDSC